MRSSAARLYSLLFFFSGATALVYELLWVRLLYQAFGATVESVTTVVAAYMAGLGLGAWWLGRRADRHPRPAALYGWLEIAVGIFGVVSPVALGLAHRLYIAVASSFPLAGVASVSLRFGLAALVLIVPTTLMGGSLPVLIRAFVGTDRTLLQPAVGRLYSLNTLGAVAGTALAGFFLTERIGIQATLWSTAFVNLALGVTAIVLARSLDPLRQVVRAHPVPISSAGPSWLRPTALALLAVTAFTALLSEIAWTRLLIMILGGSTYAFTLVLLVFLLGIGVGSALMARPAESLRGVAVAAAVAQGITAVGSAFVFFSVSLLPAYVILVFQPAHLGATSRLALLGAAAATVVLVPALGMGMTFPLLTQLVAGDEQARGAEVGRAYGLNTVGSIVGSVLTGFVLVTLYGTEATLRVGALMSVGATVVLTLAAAFRVPEASTEHRGLRPRVITAGLLAGLGLVAVATAPGWDTRLLDLGPAIYGRGRMSPAARRAFLDHRGARQLAFKEGRNATVSVWESETGRTLNVNGKVDASEDIDMDTQVMLGLAPMAAREDARSALVIGYGSGVTARVVAQVPGVRRVRVVEIEPAVLAMSPFFQLVNDSILSRPTVTAVVDDARSALQLDTARYDVIVSEPSNPWLAGVPTLYTPEFFRIVRSRLGDDGVFCQWVQTYQLPTGVAAAIVRNVLAVFPHAQVWFGGPGDLVVLGSGSPFRYDPTWMERLLGPTGALRELSREYLGVDAPRDYFGRLLVGDSGAAQFATRATVVHRDDRPELEFVAARRFLDPGLEVNVFDSLVALSLTADHRDRAGEFLLAKALSLAPWNPLGLRYVEAAHRQDPDAPYWTLQVARRRFTLGQRAFADSALPRLTGGRRDPAALLLAAVLALQSGQADRAGVLLEEALAARADTAETRADLALVAARKARWGEAASQARAALAAARATLRHPDPRPALSETLRRFALQGPPGDAERLLGEAVGRRPNWAILHELFALAALRAGDCETGFNALLELLQFGIELPDGPALVQRCRRGRTP